MKILKYIIFLSILTGIFFVIYRESDHKGFRGWRISFQVAVLIAVSEAGLIEPLGKNNQEFNSFEDNDQQIILVRNNSSSPTVRPGLAKGFSSKPRVNRPAGASGSKPVRASGFSTPRGLVTGQPVTGAHRQRTRLDGAGNPGGSNGGASSNDQCPASKEQKSKSQESITHHTHQTQNTKKKGEIHI